MNIPFCVSVGIVYRNIEGYVRHIHSEGSDETKDIPKISYKALMICDGMRQPSSLAIPNKPDRKSSWQEPQGNSEMFMLRHSSRH